MNWACENSKSDLAEHYHVFVGDLSIEVTDESLAKAFNSYPSMSDARVMWDMETGKSRGYGFLAFASKQVSLDNNRKRNLSFRIMIKQS